GCLCYTVVDAPLRFTKGISKLLNPIGELIY
ncbi:anti-sigma factor, partial [Shewanella sp. GutDb-MelDb]